MIRRAKLSGPGGKELEGPKCFVQLPRAWCLVIGKPVQLCRRRRSKLGKLRAGDAEAWKGSPAAADRIHPFVIETDKKPPHQIRSIPSIPFLVFSGDLRR